MFNIITTLLIVSLLSTIYGISVKNRKCCVICHKYPPCFKLSNCKPNNIEGYLLKFLF